MKQLTKESLIALAEKNPTVIYAVIFSEDGEKIKTLRECKSLEEANFHAGKGRNGWIYQFGKDFQPAQ